MNYWELCSKKNLTILSDLCLTQLCYVAFFELDIIAWEPNKRWFYLCFIGTMSVFWVWNDFKKLSQIKNGIAFWKCNNQMWLLLNVWFLWSTNVLSKKNLFKISRKILYQNLKFIHYDSARKMLNHDIKTLLVCNLRDFVQIFAESHNQYFGGYTIFVKIWYSIFSRLFAYNQNMQIFICQMKIQNTLSICVMRFS